MLASLQVPESTAVVTFLKHLFALSVESEDAPKLEAADVNGFAEYTDSEGRLRAVIACDLSGGAKLAAALTQIPMGAVEDSLEEGALLDTLEENLGEVFNICVNLFEEANEFRLGVDKITIGGDAAARFAEKAGNIDAVSMKLELQRYGDCRFMVATVTE